MTTQQKTEDPELKIENALSRTEEFLHRNGRTMLIVAAIVVLIVGGWMAYKHLYQARRAEKASAMMYVAQQNFAQQLWDVSLNGDGNNSGFLDVIANYGATPQGNLAKHYAGMAYLRIGDLDNAMNYLGQYKPTDGVPNAIINAQNWGLQGDIQVQKGEFAAAIRMFEKAVKAGDDDYTTPTYLRKLGLALVAAGRQSEAIEAYQRILDEYPASAEAREAEKYIGAAEV